MTKRVHCSNPGIGNFSHLNCWQQSSTNLNLGAQTHKLCGEGKEKIKKQKGKQQTGTEWS